MVIAFGPAVTARFVALGTLRAEERQSGALATTIESAAPSLFCKLAKKKRGPAAFYEENKKKGCGNIATWG